MSTDLNSDLTAVTPGPICGREMTDGHCGLPRLHRTRCQREDTPPTCARCVRPMPCAVHEGCYALGFDDHQDQVMITTRDYAGVEVVSKCRRCGAGFGITFAPHGMLR